MAKTKPDYESYDEQVKVNKTFEDKFMAQLKAVRPEIWVLADILDQTDINPFVIWKIIYAMNNLALGTGWGQVVVEIQDKTVKIVKGIEQQKLEEPLLLKDKKK